MPPKELAGVVCLPKSLFSDDLWHCEPFSLGQAWLDLWALANDRRRTLLISGDSVIVGRGQVAWSMVSLGERWHCGRQKVSKILDELQDARKIMVKTTNRTTIITVLDYTAYNPDTEPELPIEATPERTPEEATEHTADGTPERTPDSAPDQAQKRGRGELGRGEEEKRGSAAPDFAEVPSNEEVAAFCSSWPGDLARGIPGKIPEAWWAGWLADQLSRDRGFPRNWKRVLVLKFIGDWLAGHVKATGIAKKSGAGPVAASGRERGELLQAKALLRTELAGLPSDEKNAARRQAITAELATITAELQTLGR